jgi:DNA-binding response OmpR family regulator
VFDVTRDQSDGFGNRIEWPGGCFDAAARLLIGGDGCIVPLTPKESDCFRVLASAEGDRGTVSIAELAVRVWCHECPTRTGTYQHAIRSLRYKLRLSNLQVSIQTIRGKGYRLAVAPNNTSVA